MINKNKDEKKEYDRIQNILINKKEKRRKDINILEKKELDNEIEVGERLELEEKKMEEDMIKRIMEWL